MIEPSDKLRKRVLFRSHHTGMQENDLLMGAFAEQILATMSDEDVAWFESLMMDNNDVDLYNWMMKKAESAGGMGSTGTPVTDRFRAELQTIHIIH